MTTLTSSSPLHQRLPSGVPTGFVYGAGEWRHVLELADPGVGSAVAWHDLTGSPRPLHRATTTPGALTATRAGTAPPR